MDLLDFFTKCNYPFRHILEIPYPEPLRSEIRRFFISLDAYIESPNPVIPYRNILYGAADIGYAERLKRIKRKSFETTWRVEHFALPDWWDDVPGYFIQDIGDIFNYSYLIFWKEDTDDYKYGFVPVNIHDGALAKLKNYVKAILPERSTFEEVNKLEVISSLSSSISVDRKTLKGKPNYLLKDQYLSLSKERHPVKRSVVPVSPHNFRDTVLNDPGDLNTIALLDQQVMNILGKMPGHIHLTNKEKVTKRLLNLKRKCTYFLQRDLRKEGITKPRAILKVLLEALHEEYPDIEVFGYTSFYENYELQINGESFFPNRGHGLGMANALTTLMQLAIHQWIIDELTNDIPNIYSKILCINDDFTAGFKCEEHLEAYWDMEDEVMDALSLLREPTKSFRSYDHFVLAERYFILCGEYEKVSYQLRELIYPLACYNITHAKAYFGAAQVYCNAQYTGRYISDIVSYWGYEFYPKEFEYPTLCGGWVNERLNGVDLSLLLLESLPYNTLVCRGYEASQVELKMRGKGPLKRPPILQKLGIMDIPEEFHNHFDFLPQNLLNRKYGRIMSLSLKSFQTYWDKLWKKRQAEFKKRHDVTFEDLICSILNDHRSSQFYPIDMMIKSYHPCNIIRAQIDDIYLDPNPKMALLAKYDLVNYPFKESFSIRFTNPEATTKKTSSLFSKEIQRALKSEITNTLMVGQYHEIYYPSDEYRPEEQYLNPLKIGEITAILNWGKGFPELKKQFVHPLIEEKRQVYNYLFSLPELFKISQYRMSRPVIKKALELRREGESFLDLMLDIERVHAEYDLNPVEPVDEEPTDLEVEDESEDEGDRPVGHHFSDDPFGDTERETVVISMRDFLKESRSHRVWKVIGGGYQPIVYYADEAVETHVYYTMNLCLMTTDYLGTTPEKASRFLDSYRSRVGPLADFVLKKIGLWDRLINFINQEEPDVDLDAGDLFGGS